MRQIRKHARTILRYFVLVQFVFYFVSTNLFPHFHTYLGIEYYHSHPFSNPEHHHSKEELQYFELDTLMLNLFAFTVFCLLVLPRYIQLNVNSIEMYHLTSAVCIGPKSLRAPPFSF